MSLTSADVTDGSLLPLLAGILPTDIIIVRRPGSLTVLNGVQAAILLTTGPLLLPAFEIIGAGAFVHYDDFGGVGMVRNANANNPAYFATGFVLATIAAGSSGLVYPFGMNTGASPAIVVPSPMVWLSDVTPGGFVTTPPVTSGHIIQPLGTAYVGTGVAFQPQPPRLIP